MTAAKVLAAGTWQADLARSTASLRVGTLGRTAAGTVPITEGTVEIGTDGQLLAVRGTLNLSGIDTGVPKRDLDLRKPRLLDLDAHPTMTFTSTAIEASDDGWRVTGTLTARGVSTPLTGTAQVSFVDGSAAELTAAARLDRRTLGIRAPGIMIGKFVDITVSATIRQR